MASNVSNVFAAMPAVTGAVRRGPLGTAAPTNATTALNAAYVDLGYIGEDGFTESNARSTDKKKAFGGTVVKVIQTDYSATVKFIFMESINADVLRAVYGEDNVTVSGDNITVNKNKKVLPHASWVLDVLDGAGSIRTYIPDGQITEVGDIKKVHSDTIAYEVTIECFEDANGNNIVEFINKGVAAGTLPVISSLDPASIAPAGGLVTINGTGFSGVVNVKIDGTNVASYTVVDQNTIVLNAPAKTAGAYPVVVTNAAGASAPVNLTYA